MVIDVTSLTGLIDYGQVIIGDNGSEFYYARDKYEYIQTPWEEVDYVLASAMLRGEWIPRYVTQTKKNGTYTFSSKEPKKILRAVREYIDEDRMVQLLSFSDIVKCGIRSMSERK